MGKNWRGGKGGSKGGGGGNDFAACRGYGIVLGTCDAARERETSKELVNILTDAIETTYPANSKKDTTDDDEDSKFESIQDMLKSELEEVRNQKHEYTRSVMSLQTGIKGIVLIKINRKDVCPVTLVKSIFDKVKQDRLPCSRHVVRVIPLKLACFPNEDELNDSLKLMIDASFSLDESGKYFFNEDLPTSSFKLESHKRKASEKEEGADEKTTEDGQGEKEDVQAAKRTKVGGEGEADETAVADTVPDTSVTEKITVAKPVETAVAGTSSGSTSAFVPKQVAYTLSFKARNHNVLDKQALFRAAIKSMPAYARNDYRNPEVFASVHCLSVLEFMWCGYAYVSSPLC